MNTCKLTIISVIALCTTTAWAEAPKRIPRSEAFLGIHFDFHADQNSKEIGKNTTPEMVENIINLVQPDYLQVDCKGHPGFSSYPTKVGNQAPGFVGDPLRVWREVTARRGVSLLMHYSGVWDSNVVEQHPDWSADEADGKPSKKATSLFGPYANKILIPQLRELAEEYGVDGAWVDGDCWASIPDYSEVALKAFRESTDIQEIPRKPGDPHWFEFLQFNRQAFRNYLNHYIVEVKKTHPNFQICSNWAFTNYMPEKVSAPVDYLSGDYSSTDSVNSARIAARYMARQGKPWDLMAWSFTPGHGQSLKSAAQLQREAAVVIALGGGFQTYFVQKNDGSIFDEQMPVMAEVAKFCRARQTLCHRAVAVPQVAMLFSTTSNYRRSNELFVRENSAISGLLNALLEGQQSVEVLGEHSLTGRMAEYPLIILPECENLEPAFKSELLSYVKAGGKILLVGPRTAALFQEQLGVMLQGKPAASDAIQLVTNHGTKSKIKGLSQAVTLKADTQSFGSLQHSSDSALPAASIVDFGKGQIAATYFTLGKNYTDAPCAIDRDYLNDLTKILFADPIVTIEGSHDVDVSVTRNHGKLLVNLVNTGGPHRKELFIDSISPIGSLSVSIRHASRPSKVTLAPAGTPLDYNYRDGKILLKVPQVAIHEIIVVEL